MDCLLVGNLWVGIFDILSKTLMRKITLKQTQFKKKDGLGGGTPFICGRNAYFLQTHLAPLPRNAPFWGSKNLNHR